MKRLIAFVFIISLCSLFRYADAQTAYFIDGYHGGIYGHYPPGQTTFMSKKLLEHPDWAINIEIEPESWDVVKLRDPEGYAGFQKLFEDQDINTSRIEYVNPTYAQSYFFGTSGESNIRQFSYGIEMIKRHFPTLQLTTYSAEEPCFTSSLPYILKSFGFKYASTKNPNTMWGGYMRAYGGELVNWIGPDGTSILTVPRYECEELQPGSTWQSRAWFNSKEYIKACLDAGIKNPVGMTIQDAGWSYGWDKGPWLGEDTTQYYHPSHYKTWRNYITNFSVGKSTDDWHFSQEDVLTSLVWGSQVMQTLAQEVREAENSIVQAEKMAVLARLNKNIRYPKGLIDEGWIKLLLSQHHDCWIVPYNNLHSGRTWAEHVTEWTSVTNQNSKVIIDRSLIAMNGRENGNVIHLYNTLAKERDEIVRVQVPSMWANSSWVVSDLHGNQNPAQVVKEDGKTWLLFRAQVPSFGYTVYTASKTAALKQSSLSVTEKNGKYILESDTYIIELNPAKGGTIESLKSKKLNHREFVDTSSSWKFNELRGFFGEENAFISSSEHPATIRVIEQGPVSVKVAIDGMIGEHPFTQTICLLQGEEKIEMEVHIEWQGNPAIGEQGIVFKAEDPRKAFYDDRYKLLVSFPAAINTQQIYKDAPFDVCKSRLGNTYFNRWDEIKHVILLNWVDLASEKKDYGMTLFSDHTTSYVHGEDHPLSLTLQYAGRGLWGRDYVIDRPTTVSYAIMPHAGLWDDSKVWTKSEQTNEPVIGRLSAEAPNGKSISLFGVEDDAYELVSMEYKEDDLYIRLFNAQGDDRKKEISFAGAVQKAELVELNGDVSESLSIDNKGGSTSVSITMPRFGIRTLKLTKPSLN